MRRSFVICVFLLFLGVVVAHAESPAAAIRRGKALEKAQKFSEALQVYKNSLMQKPTNEVYREAASLMGKLQRYDKAQVLLQKGLIDFPNDVELMNLLALIQLRKGEEPGARKLWEQVLRIDAQNAFAKSWLGKLGTPDGKLAEPVAAVQATPADEDQAQTPSGTVLSIEEQEKLAKASFETMINLDKWETDQFESIYREVIEKCPDVDAAQESCWRLSNLYLLSADPPNFDGIIEVLEHLMKKYPDSPLIPAAKNRLTIAYERTGRHESLANMYEELFQRNPQLDDRQYMIYAIEYANALAALGRVGEARDYYQKAIDKDNNRDTLEGRVAIRKLSEM